MTSRERVRLSLAHKEPDRIPFDLGSRSSAIEEEAYDSLKRFLNIEGPTRNFIRSHAIIDPAILNLLGVDTDYVRAIPSRSWQKDGEDDLYLDKWEVPWRKRKGSYYYELDKCPLGGLSHEEILGAPWRPLVSDSMIQDMREQAIRLHENTDAALFTDFIGAGIFERAWYLRGFEEFSIELMVEKDFAHAFLNKILERQLEAYRSILDAIGPYIEGIWVTDDLATQDSLMFSPELYREMIKPYHRVFLDFMRSRGAKVIFHSCGAVYPLIPDLLEIGVEIMHPIQLNARGMDTAILKKEFGKDLVFWGGGCDIEILQRGSAEEVRDESTRRIRDLAPGGGFVFTPTHCIQPHTPPENVITMVETLREYGNY